MSFDLSRCFDKNKRPHVLVLHKKSRLSLYQERSQGQYINELIDQGHHSTRYLELAHHAHNECLNFVIESLKSLGVLVSLRQRSRSEIMTEGNPIIVTVGGDGTILEASHFALNSPIFGVNSDPERSVGAMCVATQENFTTLFGQLLAGTLLVQPIKRLGLKVNEQILPYRALNEILISHQNPAATSRYLLRVRNTQEEQLSSGLWIAGPAGSTGAMNSAGGLFRPLNDTNMQYAVREPCFFWNTQPTLLGGVFSDDEDFQIISEMPKGRVFIDGSYKWWDLPMGHQLSIVPAAPVWLAINSDLEQRRLELSKLRNNIGGKV